ncbi:hypothetical protein AK37_14278 [Rhodococcus pyridinivorans AK37]|uniref:Uncharacterized protein n=1 Tax=Rhodococcus pyridinivorans AK37 TaxID=1114960 RepID=H0JT44_9NOCA|nr:hypothetical protein AK37_14278 [Rhodococcus pyridinivorans AK37]
MWADTPDDVTTIDPAEDVGTFVVEDDIVEVAVDWIETLRGDRQTEERIDQRRRCRWPLTVGSVTDTLLNGGGLSRSRNTRAVEFEVRASHYLRSGRQLVCEVYPHVFVGQRGGAISRYAGMAMQQPGDIVTALPPVTQKWIRIRGLKQAASGVSTVANIGDRFWIEQHGAKTRFSEPPVGPVGPTGVPP